MCTNYVRSSRDLIREHLQQEMPTFEYEPELWPGYKGPILISGLEWRLAMFGMVPYFSKDGKDFRETYNACAETADVRPTYRGPGGGDNQALCPWSPSLSRTMSPVSPYGGGSSERTRRCLLSQRYGIPDARTRPRSCTRSRC